MAYILDSTPGPDSATPLLYAALILGGGNLNTCKLRGGGGEGFEAGIKHGLSPAWLLCISKFKGWPAV